MKIILGRPRIVELLLLGCRVGRPCRFHRLVDLVAVQPEANHAHHEDGGGDARRRPLVHLHGIEHRQRPRRHDKDEKNNKHSEVFVKEL